MEAVAAIHGHKCFIGLLLKVCLEILASIRRRTSFSVSSSAHLTCRLFSVRYHFNSSARSSGVADPSIYFSTNNCICSLVIFFKKGNKFIPGLFWYYHDVPGQTYLPLVH